MQPSIKMFFKPKEANQVPQVNIKKSPDKELVEVTNKRPAEDDEECCSVTIKRQAFDSPSATPVKRSPPPINTPFRGKTRESKIRTPSSSYKSNGNYGSPVASQPILDEDRQHLHRTYKFLLPENRRDILKRKPDDPDYDEKTLYVPEEFLNSQTPALRQWWLIKQKNMDAILFFKMGKFYELFNEDAVIAVNNLDIMYMKGDETKPAHAGFPEVSYEKYSRILIEKNFKVLRIEQTETPAMMEIRCQETGRRGKFDKVVKREVCRVTTKGTQMLGVMESVFHSSKHQYLLAICEASDISEDGTSCRAKTFGVCFIDVTICRLFLSQFVDDNNLSKLNILLSQSTPTEVLYERNNLSKETMQALTRTGALLTLLKSNKEFWPIKKTLSYLKTHYIFQNDSGDFEWPCLLKSLFREGDSSESLLALEEKEEYKLALSSFGALVYYLQSQLIHDQVLKCATFELYRSPLEQSSGASSSENKIHFDSMILDHIALRNLEIFENSTGGTNSTLFESLNFCKTHFGQRLLQNWMCSPLCDIKQINNRLDAVECLISNDNASLMNEFAHVLGMTPDLERLLSKIKSQCFKSESDARAIMFDGHQYSKSKITSFLNLLQNFKRLQKFIHSVSKSVQGITSSVLKRLLTLTTEGGLYPDYSSTLEYFETAFDHEVAKKTGQIIPAPGVDKAYDKCQANIERIKNRLIDYLEEQKSVLKCRNIEYFGSAKNRYQIQVPESYCKNVTSDYYIETTRKGYKRYYTPAVTKLFKELTVYEEELAKTLDSIMSRIFEQFSRKVKLWSAAIDCIAILDVLQSIASFVRSLKSNNVDVCRPIFIENQEEPLIEYKNGRHPALVKIDPNYIPNDLNLDQRLLLLSGANMGGKSTLMRQTALMVILAQIGSFVPASKMRLTPIDRVFSRLGASDNIMEGESTFYTELVETSAMLHSATNKSLLLLDELGRGTSTFDGTAIAFSVIKEISSKIRCRCLFSTHYHTLVKDFQNDDKVRLAHMACKIEKESSDEIELDPLKENITFLYKIAEGPVGRSYGFNVAKLAGIEDEIIREAFKKAKELELDSQILDTTQRLCRNESHPIGITDLKNRVLKTLVK